MIKLKSITKIFLLAAAMVFSLTGCVTVSFPDNFGQGGEIRGKGETITKEYSVSEYSAVEIDANMDIVYIAGSSDIVKVEIQENLSEHLKISVNNEKLFIEADRNFIYDDNKAPVIYIAAPTLSELSVKGLVEIKDFDQIQSSEFQLLIDGSLNGMLEIDTDKLTVELNGIGNVTLSGSASSTKIKLDGAGALNALKLETKDSSVQLDGAGSISLSCSDTLDVQIDGAGTVNYMGTPSIEKQIDGIGSLNSID